jgi:phosphoglucan,water dikinase
VTTEVAGGKANGARRLAELARKPQAGFATPPGLAIPFAAMEAALQSAPGLEREYRQACARINGLTSAEFASAAERLRHLLGELPVPGEVADAVAARFKPDDRLMVRSSANCEDLEQFAGAGLYDSVANVAPADAAAAVRRVWASLWTERAALSRKQAGIPYDQAHMAVLIQRLLQPDYSFVLHTVNPLTQNPAEIYAELAVGLGETLASAAVPGTPYRFACDKKSAAVTTLACASFSLALWPDPSGGLVKKTLDYSQIELSRSPEAGERLVRQLAAIAGVVEQAFGGPQDLEGAVVAQTIYLVQTRAQQGLAVPYETQPA